MYAGKRINLQFVFYIVLCVSIPFSLTACAEPAPPPEPVTIRFDYAGIDNRASEREFYQNLADQFNQEYPHITVEVGFISLSSIFYGDGLDWDAVSIPDFILPDFVDQEIILPLDGLIQKDPDFPYDDFYPGLLDIYSRQGQTWGLPAGVDPYVFYFNKDLFDRAGIPYPGLDWTLDDFLTAAVAVRDPAAGIFGYGPTLIFGLDSDYMESIVFIYQHGGKILDDFREPTFFIFDDPAAIEALEWYAALYHTHGIAPTEEQALETFGELNSIYQGISNQQIAIWGGQLSERDGQSYMPVTWDFDYGILPPPGDRDTFYMVYSNAFVIAAETEHPEETWLWIDFLTEQPGYNAFPVRRSVIESKPFEDLVGEEIVTVIKIILEDPIFLPTDFDYEIGRDFQNFQRALDRIVNQGDHPEDAMDWARRR